MSVDYFRPPVEPEAEGAPTKAAVRRRVRLLPLGAIAAMPSPEWRVYKLVSGLTLLWAGPGSFKSFLLVSWAVSVASGRPWFGRVVKQGAVVLVVGEGALRALYNRIRAAALVLGLPASEVDALPIYVTEGPVDLSKWDGIQAQELRAAALEVVATAGTVGLLGVDTVSRCVPGRENDQETMQGFVATLDELRLELECDVVAVHHSNAEGERERGSSVLGGAVDSNLRLQAGAPDERGVPLSLYAIKLKESESSTREPAVRLRARRVVVEDVDGFPVKDEAGHDVTTCVLEEAATEDTTAEDSTDSELLAAIPETGISASKLAERLHRRKKTVADDLARLRRAGKVHPKGTGPTSRWVLGSIGSIGSHRFPEPMEPDGVSVPPVPGGRTPGPEPIDGHRRGSR